MSYMGYKIVDGFRYITKSPGYLEECKLVRDNLKEFGFLFVKNPYYEKQLHFSYINALQEYFEKRSQLYLQKNHSSEINSAINFQRGLTPHKCINQQRIFENFRNSIKSMKDLPVSPLLPEPDLCWRYLQWIKEDNINYPVEMAPNINVKDIKNFNSICHEWGTRLLKTARLVAEMLALGMELEENTFTSLLNGGEHLLGPTGTDLTLEEENTALSKLHYDLNFFTAHGPSSYPGLYVWVNGDSPKKLSVIAPEGTFLVQNGMQIEILTGGYLKAGFHEVVNTNESRDAANLTKRNGGSGFRVGSILFSQVRSDYMLEPLEKFRNISSSRAYKPILASDQIEDELKRANLSIKN